MLPLTEAVTRRWAEARAAFESACRSGAGSQPDADAILDDLARLVRLVAWEELEAIRRASGRPPRSTPATAMTTDLSAAYPAASTGQPGGNGSVRFVVTPDPGSDPGAVTGELGGTVPPAATGASDAGFELHPPTADPHALTPTGDHTGAYTPADSQFDPTASRPAGVPDRAAKRKPPAIPGYEILGVLGRGGMGVVYKARQTGLSRTVALKMVLAGEHAGPAQLARFAAEARAVAQIRHPNIVQVYETGEHDGLPYFSLEFCPGGSLDKKLRHEPQPPRQAAALAEQLARALAAAHAAGVVHRDIKPANVLLDADGTPKVTDFGLARELEEAGQTRTGSILGTPNYMSPEQALGRTKEVGPAADQYSLGATLYELITGRPPFQGATPIETLEQVRSKEPVPPTQLQPGCPRDLETICLKALAKEPQKRYPGCAALADDLRAFLDGRPITARPVGTAEKAWRWARRNPRVAGLAGLVAALCLVIGAGGATAAVIFDKKKREAEDAKGYAELKEQEAKASATRAEERRVEAEKAREEEKTARLAEAEARKEEARSSEYARSLAIEAVDNIPGAAAEAIFARAVERQVLDVLAVMLDKQLKYDAARGLPDRALFTYHLKTGELLQRQAKFAEAETHLTTAQAITQRLLATETREKDKAKANHALVVRMLGTLAWTGRKDTAGAVKLYTEAIRLQREVAGQPQAGEIPPAEAKQSLAATLSDLARLYAGILRFDLAFEPCDQAVKLLEEVVRDKPTVYTADAPRHRADAYLLLGRIQANRGKDAEAEAALTEAVNGYRGELKKHPASVTLQVLAAKASRELGDFLLMRGQLDRATPYHEWDLELTGALLRTGEILAAQSDLSDVYYRSATLALKKGDRESADRLYRKCLDLRLTVAEAGPDDWRLVRVANAQARCGLHREATRTMDAVLARFAGKPNALLLGTQVFSICADTVTGGRPEPEWTADERALRQMYADRAVLLIEELTTKYRYTNVVKLKTDPDLDGVRPDPRFQALIRRLEEPAGKK